MSPKVKSKGTLMLQSLCASGILLGIYNSFAVAAGEVAETTVTATKGGGVVETTVGVLDKTATSAPALVVMAIIVLGVVWMFVRHLQVTSKAIGDVTDKNHQMILSVQAEFVKSTTEGYRIQQAAVDAIARNSKTSEETSRALEDFEESLRRLVDEIAALRMTQAAVVKIAHDASLMAPAPPTQK